MNDRQVSAGHDFQNVVGLARCQVELASIMRPGVNNPAIIGRGDEERLVSESIFRATLEGAVRRRDRCTPQGVREDLKGPYSRGQEQRTSRARLAEGA